ncbi:Nucleoporin NUP133 [Yarrowia sp. C11]|nr:Nucleoporin NUP133 [Yarrowia sp. E02]KAG5369645.1 Nucleoporin NUP133 [Yarrowia sp. C11]
MSQIGNIRKLRQKAVQLEINRAVPLFNDDVTEKSFTNLSTVEDSMADYGSEITRTAMYSVTRLAARPDLSGAEIALDSGEHVSSSLSDDFGLVIVGNKAHVWKYTSPEPTPVTFTHSLGVQDSALGHLIPVTPSFKDVGHPGLVLVGTNSGQCVFWESVGGAASEGYLRTRQQVETQIKLYSGEVIEHVNRMDNVTLVLSLSSGRLVGLSLRDRDEAALNYWTLRDTKAGLLSNIRSAFSISPNRRGITGVRTVPSPQGWRIYVATSECHLGVWEVAEGGDATILADKDLKPMLSADVSTLYNTSSIYLHDIEYVAEEDYLVVLTSILVDSSIFYIIYTIDLKEDKVVSRHRVQSYVRKGLDRGTPRLARPSPGDTLYVVLDHAVVLIDMVTRSNLNFLEYGKWEDSILLKHTVSILGFGAEDKSRSHDSAIVAITDAAGVLKITRFPEQDDKEQTRSINTLERGICKSRIEQGVFFSGGDFTPLHFSATGEYDVKFSDEVVCGALLQVSHEICTSTSPHLEGRSPGMGSSLEFRMERLRILNLYAQENFASQLDIGTKLTLASNAEKLAACEAIWAMLDVKDGYIVLENIIVKSVDKNQNPGQDPVQDFFTSRILEAAELIYGVFDNIQQPNMGSIFAATVGSAISAILTVREEALSSLHVSNDETSESCPWWCEARMMETWDALFRFIAEKTNDYRPLGPLAQSLCSQSVVAITWARNSGNDWQAYENTYHQRRGDWIRAVVSVGQVTQALHICENFHLYRCLAEILDHDLQTAITNNNKQSESDAEYAIRKYFHDFGYDFASPLYTYWIEKRDFESLFTRFQDYRDLLKQYFRSGNHANISWILSLGLGEYQAAAEALVQAAKEGQETIAGGDLRNRLVQLSMAKLSFMQARVGTKIDPSREQIEVNNELNLSLIQKHLAEHISGYVKGKQIFSEQILSPQLPKRVSDAAKKLVTKVAANKVLTSLELIELCSCVVGFSEDALRAIADSNHTKTGIMSSTVWIRALLETDWSHALDKSDRTDQEQEALLLDTPLFQLLSYAFETGLIGQQNSPLQVPNFENLHKPNSATLASDDRFRTNLDSDLLSEFDTALKVLDTGDTQRSVLGLINRARLDAHNA